METTVASFFLQKTRIPGRIFGNVLLAMTVLVAGAAAKAFDQKPALKTGKSLKNAMLTTVS
jgi:hypothetical protein